MYVQDLYQTTLFAFAQSSNNARFANDFYDAINDAQKEFINTRKWGFLRTTGTVNTIDGTRYVTLPTDFGNFYGGANTVRLTSPSTSVGRIVEVITFDQYYNQFYTNTTDEGEPSYCWIQAGLLYFEPIPDAVYAVAFPYYKRATAVTTTADPLTIPEQYSEVLKKMVYRRLMAYNKDAIADLQTSDNDVEKLMNRAARDDIATYGGFNMNLDPDTVTSRYT